MENKAGLFETNKYIQISKNSLVNFNNQLLRSLNSVISYFGEYLCYLFSV